MNKFLRKVIVLAMTGSMIAGTAATVSAADATSSGLNTSNQVSADTSSINLIKNYTLGTANYNEAKSPEETFEFTIEPYGVWNAGSSTGAAGGEAYFTSNMPALAQASNDDNNADSGYTVTVESKPGSSSVANVNKVTIHTEKNYANNNNSTTFMAKLDLNDFYSVGDFWYQVVETNNATAGVIYGTNDNSAENRNAVNNGHNAIYYIHVQVINNSAYNGTTNTQKFLRSVTMHKTAPKSTTTSNILTNKEYNEWTINNENNYQFGAKVNNIQNTYYAGSLSIKKEVTGNAGDKEKRFEVTVVFTKPKGTVITSDITYSAATSANATTKTEQTINGQNNTDTTKNKWMIIGSNGTETTISAESDVEASATAKIYIKDGETVTFNNIPYGVTYKVYETEPTNDNYTNKLVFTSNSNEEATSFNGTSLAADADKKDENDNNKLGSFFGEENAATGSISDTSDEITITNHKESTIDVGVITSNAPYIAMLILAAAAAFVFIRRRRDLIEE